MKGNSPDSVAAWLVCGDMCDFTYIYGNDLEDFKPDKLDILKKEVGAYRVKKRNAEFFMALYTDPSGKNELKNFAGFVAVMNDSKGIQDVYIAWRGTVLKEE